MTPIEFIDGIWVKREDLFEVAGCRGAKARACWAIATDPKNADKLKNGLVTAGSRKSPQINIVAHIAKELGVYCEAHTPQGDLSPELLQAKELGAVITQHRAGYNSVIKKRAKDRAAELNALEIPFGMECQEAIEQTAEQAVGLTALANGVRRIVLPIGSGINASGLLCGLSRNHINIPVVGIRVGADPIKILDRYAPLNWRQMMTIETAPEDYHLEIKASLGDVQLDPIYEAKCLKYLQPGDLFWIIGKRNIINKKSMEEQKQNEQKESAGILRDRYIEPPFSILDARGGNWRQRKNKWLELGIKSEEGRDAECLIGENDLDYMPSMKSGVSIFDPALCELMYKWFCPENGAILDSFAGGSVRGIVAHKMGYKYTGIELRPEQVAANIEQGKEICAGNEPTWICGDSNQVLDTIHEEFDMIFSCPPYADLEVYSNDKDDLSNMPYDKFLHLYRSIILKSVEKLKTGGFAVFVVGDVRDKDGYYYDFISDTKKAFIVAGAGLYNEAILLDPIGTAMIRANNFAGSRKLVKVHQNILIFKKQGDISEELKQKVKTGYELSKKCPKCGSPDGIMKRKSSDGRTRFTCQDCLEDIDRSELGSGLFE